MTAAYPTTIYGADGTPYVVSAPEKLAVFPPTVTAAPSVMAPAIAAIAVQAATPRTDAGQVQIVVVKLDPSQLFIQVPPVVVAPLLGLGDKDKRRKSAT